MAKTGSPKQTQATRADTASEAGYRGTTDHPAVAALPEVAIERERAAAAGVTPEERTAAGADQSPSDSQTRAVLEGPAASAAAPEPSADTAAPSASAPDTRTERRTKSDRRDLPPRDSTTVVERKGGFFPMLLGGAAAAAIGFGLAQYLGPLNAPVEDDSFETDTRAALEGQQGTLEALSGRIDGVETGLSDVDLQSVETAIADLTQRTGELGTDLSAVRDEIGGMGDRLTAIETALTGLDGRSSTVDERLSALEKRPMEASVSPETIAAYEREMDELRASVADQLSAVEAQRTEIETQRQEVASLAEEAVAAERAAADQADLAERRAAAITLLSQVSTGGAYADVLEPVAASMTVPDVISQNAEDGVASLAELAESFPDAARAALAEARRSGASEGGGGMTGFLSSQLGMRSVTPRDGDGPDAVLSRAEAAVVEGELETALSEISSLPEAAQAPLADWTSRARTRLEAISAAEGIVQNLNQE